MITNSMEPHEESELVSLVEDYANEIRAWDKKQIGARPHLSRQDIIDYVGSLLAAKDAEIKRLHARQITPEMEAAFRGLKAKMFGAGTPDLVSILMGEFADLMVLMEAAIDPETGEG